MHRRAIVTGPLRSLSDIRRPGRNIFKGHLLRNRKAEIHEIWQECSLGRGISKLFKSFRSDIQDGRQAAILKMGTVPIC